MSYWLVNHIDYIQYFPLIYFVSILIFLLIGWLYGRYRLHHFASVIIRDSLVTAIFGLSALVLGFTFSNAADNANQRINLIHNQASSLRQVHQSIEYLNTSDRVIVQKRLGEILSKRLSVYNNVKTLEELNANLDALNDQLAILNKEVTDAIPRTSVENREAAIQILRPQLATLVNNFQIGIQNALHHPPEVIEAFLFVVLGITALLSGYSMAVKKEDDWFLTIIYLGLMGFALYVIFALDYPNEILNFNNFNGDLIRMQKILY
jgi:hypothetical protein